MLDKKTAFFVCKQPRFVLIWDMLGLSDAFGIFCILLLSEFPPLFFCLFPSFRSLYSAILCASFVSHFVVSFDLPKL